MAIRSKRKNPGPAGKGRVQQTLKNPKNRARALAILQETGELQAAYTALGISENAFRDYRKAQPEFDQACQGAIAQHTIMIKVRYSGVIEAKALQSFLRKLEADQISDYVLHKILFKDEQPKL